MKTLRLVAALCLLALSIACPAPATAEVAVPPLTGRVVDLTGTLSKDRIAALEGRLRDLEGRKGSQIAVLMLPSVKPEDIAQYSIRVAEAWKIGRRKVDDGLLVVIAKDDHRMRIEVGRGLEGAIPDITARRVIDEHFTPDFKKNDYAAGIDKGVDRLIRLVDGEPLPPAPRQFGATGSTNGNGHGADDGTTIGLVAFAVVAVILGAILNGALGHMPGSLLTGGGMGLAIGLFAGAGWGIGAALAAFVLALLSTFILQALADGGLSSGGGWSSSGGSSGGFSGGGGDFGGGGASGDW